MQVHREVQFQMRRISWHPSVIIWGGNNEVETALGSWYVADYTALFLCMMQKLALEVNPWGIFLDSSPSNALLTHDYSMRGSDYIKRCYFTQLCGSLTAFMASWLSSQLF